MKWDPTKNGSATLTQSVLDEEWQESRTNVSFLANGYGYHGADLVDQHTVVGGVAACAAAAAAV